MKHANGDALGTGSVETLLTHGGRSPEDQFGFVNTPVYRGSTVLYDSLDDLEAQDRRYLYGRAGNPTTTTVEQVVTQLEGAHGTRLVPSGLAAITVALLACVGAGDEVLVTDSAYEPGRKFVVDFLGRMGVTSRFYDPRIGGGIAGLIGPATRAILVESPGSGTFEIQDLPAIAATARAAGNVRVVVDNSWATPLFYQPLNLGADIVVHAATKMFVGHSDAFGGTISATQAAFEDVERTRALLGLFTAGDEAFLISRGLRTLAVRMKEHAARSVELARWLEGQPGVSRVLHPALPSHPDHSLFKRDFSGAGSLFGAVLEPAPRERLAAFFEALNLFAIGFSWGGYESLCVPVRPKRTAVPWTEPGNLIRIHCGFEGMDDLKADLEGALHRYRGV